jgi:hypothetical protein
VGFFCKLHLFFFVIQIELLFFDYVGNLVTVALVAIIGNHLSKANEFFFFAAGCVVAMLLLLWAGSHFVYKQRRGPQVPVDDTQITPATLIVHATDDRAYVG